MDSNISLTMSLHTDQGLFIAFTPAMMVHDATGEPASNAKDAVFRLQLKDGTTHPMEFDEDALVFMVSQTCRDTPALARKHDAHDVNTVRKKGLCPTPIRTHDQHIA